jgi:hypothetical protein
MFSETSRKFITAEWIYQINLSKKYDLKNNPGFLNVLPAFMPSR